MKFKSTLSCLLILISIVATFSPITKVFCEKNSLLKNFEDVSSSIAEALEDPVSSSSPDPDVYEIDYPSSITLGESAYITIRGKNRGDDANEGDLSISFPGNPSDVAIINTDASNSHIAWPGDLIWVGYGDHREPAEYPLAEVWEAPWRAGSARYLSVRVTPEVEESFTFYVKMVAEAGGVWYGDPKTDGSESSRRDQQDEYVRRYTIDVGALKPDPDVYDVDYPSSITLGESAYITIRGKNRGDEADEGYLSMSFPDDPDDVEIVDTNAAHSDVSWPGEWIWAGYGQYQVRADYPLAEVWEAPWSTDTRRRLEVRVTPEIAGTFTFYVKMVAQAGGVWFADPPVDGSESSRSDQQDEYVWRYTIDVQELPEPSLNVWVDSYPSSITLGESAYIKIYGENLGDAAAEGYLQISFPDNPSDVEIVSTDASHAAIAWPGDWIWAGYGQYQVIAEYPHVEVREAPWSSGVRRCLEVKVTPESVGTFTFYVKMVAEAGGVWFADPKTDGSESPIMDEQREYVWKYTIDGEPRVPIPNICGVDYPSSIALGQGADITICGENLGDQADEGYLSVSFPNNPSAVEITYTDASNSRVYLPGDWVWAGYGQYEIQVQYPLVEIWESPWPSGTRRHLEVKVTPKNVGEFCFYVKMVAQAGGVWYGDPPVDGSESSRRDQQDEYVWQFCFEVESVLEPLPYVWVDSYPSSITLGESAYIKIYGENLGDQAGEGDLQISFPDNPSDVEIVSTDASHSAIAWPGDWIWAGYGQYQVVADYPHAEVWEAPWSSGVSRYLEVRVKPGIAGTFTFYVKMVAEAGGVWFADPKTDGSESPIMDEQDEYVYGHTIEVVEISNVDAEIVDFDVEEGTFHPGDVVQAEAVISNIGDCTHTFRIDYAIRDGGGHYWGVYSDDREIAEGASLTLNDELDWSVPPGVAEGDCDGRLLVLDSDTSETYDSQWDREGPTIFKEPAEPPDLTVFDPEFGGRTVCLNGVVFGATRLHWDWDDGYEEDHWFAACHTYETHGTYTITVTAYSGEGLTSTETKTVHTLTIESSIGGYTDPSAGSYFCNGGDEVSVTAYPYEDYTLDHWILDGYNAASGNPTQVVMDSSHTLEPGFKLTQLPDFGTYEGWPDPWSPKAGDEVTFWAEAFLDADEPYTVWIDWHLDGSPFEAKRVTLSQGQNIISTDESWTAKVGEHTIRWVIDESNEFQETDETNNEEEMEFSVEEIDKQSLIFNVIFEGHCYTVSLWVPSLTYTNVVQQIGSIIYTWYPNVQKSILEQAYYVWYHVESPNSFPILNVYIEENGQPISEKALKIQVIDALLKYCFQLFNAAWPDKLAECQSFGEQWLNAYEGSAWTVQVSDALSNVHFLTIIGPIIGSIKHLYGATTSVQVKETVSLVYKILRGTPELVKSFGTQKTNTIVNTLISFGLISSSDYNGMELYRKLESDPSIAMDFIESIDSEILGFNLNSDASSIVYNSLAKIPMKSIGVFVPGVALGLYAYFGSGLTASTASQILSGAFFTGILKYAIPLAIADAIAEGYIVPMASAIHAAWEDMGYMAESYFNMYEFGLSLTEPNDNTLDLTKAKIFACLYGALCIQEYDYYMNTYFYRSHQLFVPQSELDGYKSSAQLILSQAEEWANVLDSISAYAEAIVLSTDPEGSTFDFPLQPPHDNVLPAVQENASGFVLVTDSTLDITMKCENFLFTVQDGMWFSDFTYSVFFDDPNGTSYAVIFNPPEQNYAVNTQNETLIALRNFESLNGNVIVSDVGEVTGTDLYFYVSDSSAEASSVIPEFPLLFILPLFMIATLLVAILYRRRQST